MRFYLSVTNWKPSTARHMFWHRCLIVLVFQEQNDPLKNDRDEQIDDVTLDMMKDLGFFGLQVPTDLGAY